MKYSTQVLCLVILQYYCIVDIQYVGHTPSYLDLVNQHKESVNFKFDKYVMKF